MLPTRRVPDITNTGSAELLKGNRKTCVIPHLNHSSAIRTDALAPRFLDRHLQIRNCLLAGFTRRRQTSVIAVQGITIDGGRELVLCLDQTNEGTDDWVAVIPVPKMLFQRLDVLFTHEFDHLGGFFRRAPDDARELNDVVVCHVYLLLFEFTSLHVCA
jgi:hypothetical protein